MSGTTNNNSDHNGNSKFDYNANSPHDFAAHVEHQLGLEVLAPDQEQYGGYAFINDDTIVARSPITGLRPVIEQAIQQIVGNKTIEQAAKALGGFDNLESKIAQKLTQLNDWANLTQETQNEVMILTGINFDAMTAAEQEKSINHLQHSPLPFGDIKQVLAESVTIDMGFTHTLDKSKTVSEHVGDGIYKVSMISNNNNGSHTGHNLGSFLVDMNKYAAENADGQYATSATASSSLRNTQTEISGKPDGSPWYSKTNSTGDVVIELNYQTASKVSGIELVGTSSYATGHVTKVELKDEDGNWHTVWTGDETSTKADKTLELSFDATDFNTQNARVTVDTSQGASYQAIDAVKLIAAKSEEDDGSGREAKAIEIGNQMVKNTNNYNELYLDGSAQDILYGRTEELDFSSMESGHGEGGSPGAGHHFTEHVGHQFHSGMLIETQEAYGGYSFINDNHIIARSPLTGLQPVVEQAIDQIIGNRTLEQAAARYGGYDKLESKIANQITQLNDWQQLTEATQAKIMIMTGINFDGMTKAEQEKTINHLQHSPLPFGEIKEVLSTSVKIELGYTHTLDKTKTEVENLGEGIWEIKLISNNNNGSHTGHNLGSFRIDLGANGNASIAKQVGNQMVQNTNDNNKLYLDSAARDVLYGRVERNDFDMDSAYEQSGQHGGFNHVYGTNGNDRLEGTDGNDQMHGKGGNDVFYGGKGDDQFLGDGGDYNQVDFDGNSSDWKFVQNANGTVTATHAEYGTKLLSNIDGAWFFGDSKYYTVDQLVEGIDDDGGGETDGTITGTAGDDYIVGTDGDDVIKAGDGVDVIFAGAGNDVIDGEGGDYNQVDLLGNSTDYTFTKNEDGSISAVHADYGTKTLSNIDGVWFIGDEKWSAIDDMFEDNGGGETGITITGTADDDYLVGTDGDDVIKGGEGMDVIFAGAGNDNIDGEGGDYNQVDLLGASTDYTFTKNDDGTVTAVHADYGTKTLSNIDGAWFIGDQKWSAIDDLLGSDGGETGGNEGKTFTGTAGDDYLVGTDGDDVFLGGDGNDVFSGGKGNDSYDGQGGDYNQVDFKGNSSDYTFTKNADGTITAEHAEYGKDILKEIDGVWFEGDNQWHNIDDMVA